MCSSERGQLSCAHKRQILHLTREWHCESGVLQGWSAADHGTWGCLCVCVVTVLEGCAECPAGVRLLLLEKLAAVRKHLIAKYYCASTMA